MQSLPFDRIGYIFDLDGTLLDSLWVWDEVDEIFLTRRGLTVTPDYKQAVAHMGAANTARYTIERFGLHETPEQIMEEWHTLAFEAYRDRVLLKPFVYELLEQLEKQQIQVAAATSSDRTLIEPCLKRLHIFDQFEHIMTVGEVGHDKSSPVIYQMAAARMGLSPAQCIVFEDILRAVQTAKSAGFFTVAVAEPRSSDDWPLLCQTADCCIQTFADLLI